RFLPRRGAGDPRGAQLRAVQHQGPIALRRHADQVHRRGRVPRQAGPMDKDLPGHLHQARQMILHEGDGDHVHEISAGRRGELTEYIWKVENVELATVGIDIGSSTSHLMFATVRLQRKTQALSSAFVVVERRILWKSPILLTPFLADGSIDAEGLEA